MVRADEIPLASNVVFRAIRKLERMGVRLVMSGM